MALAILHLSDLHIRSATDALCERGPAIAKAIRSQASALEGCLIAVTGDIAYSGTSAQYDAAKTFFASLCQGLLDAYGTDLQVQVVAIPGNHDCDFTGDQALRDIVIAGLAGHLETMPADGSIASQCVCVQRSFFDFEGDASGEGSLPVSARLFYTRVAELSGHLLRVNCYNTAWVSRLNEVPGQLLYPVQLARAREEMRDTADLAVALFHHPYNWLAPDNAAAFRRHIEKTADVALTGHEHREEAFRKIGSRGEDVGYLAGNVLQDVDSTGDTGFHLLMVDLERRKQQRVTFRWRQGLYEPHPETPTALVRNPLVSRQRFELRREFEESLSEPGTAFTHPRRVRLTLDDLFVYPDFTKMSPDEATLRKDSSERRLRGAELEEHIAKHSRLVVSGAPVSGKTALSKMLFRRLHRGGRVPVLIQGGEITAASEEAVQQVTRDAFTQAYDASMWERYMQLTSAERVVIVDDFHRTKLNKRGQIAWLDVACVNGSVILLSDDLFAVGFLAGADARDGILGTFEYCAIRPFGHRLRARLIGKWHWLGQENSASSEVVEHAIATAERQIDALLGKNLLPSYPLTILMILQSLEAVSAQVTTSGAYGYLYELLITTALSQVSLTSADLDTTYAYISHLAFALYQSKAEGLSREEIAATSERYSNVFRVSVSQESMVAALTEARILTTSSAVGVRFRYRYVYCYFVARYLRDNMAHEQEELKRLLRSMADSVHYENHADILVFYLYLTRDFELIEYVLECARRIYAGRVPCDMAAGVGFVNRLYTVTEPLELPPGDYADHQEEFRDRLDREEEGEGEFARAEDARDLVYDEKLDDLLKMNFAMKTLHVMGQVLRNFPGSLPGPVKADLAREGYLLGLRTLTAALGLAGDDLEAMRGYLAQLIKERRAVESPAELAKDADELLIWIALAWGFGIVKRVSYALGLARLERTYADVLAELGDSLSVRLIDLSIKLDHFPAIPMADIRKLSEDLERNRYGWTVLRDLVANHLYLFPVEISVKQKLGALLSIRSTEPRFLMSDMKKTR